MLDLMTAEVAVAGMGELGQGALGEPPSVRHRWFVLQYVSSFDRLVFRWLNWLGIEFYQFTHLRKTSDGPQRVHTFPGYLFVRFDVSCLTWIAINSIPGVIRILSSCSGYPIPLPEGLLEAMIEFHGSKPIKAPAELDPIRVGERVEITSGPFEGQVFEVGFTDEHIIGVFVTIFGRTSSVKVPKSAARRAFPLSAGQPLA